MMDRLYDHVVVNGRSGRGAIASKFPATCLDDLA